ncbi:MAG TPA: hypothetical protein VGI43_04890 [Mucilaginibacter sp.]|jgi:hypothetical protein
MKKIYFAILLFGFLFCQLAAIAQTNNRKINIGLFPPLSSNWTDARKDTNVFSFNVLAGLSAGETGFGITGLVNVVRGDASGFQLAGFSNHIGKSANGFLVAGFMNTSAGGRGFEIAGFGNFAKTSSGGQVAGFANVSGDISSVQTAGFMNIAGKVNGVQVAGFINVAKNVRGTQFAGLINIADTANCQIGFVNISKNGEISLAATFDENHTLLLSLRSGGKFLYGIIGLGYNVSNKENVYAYQAGFGAHLINAEPVRLNAELTGTALLDFKDLTYYKAAFAALPSLRLGDRIDLFAGPSIVYIETNSTEDIMRHKKYISSWGGENGEDFHGFYIGYTAGIAIRL